MIAIIDYGTGNIASVAYALDKIKADYIISDKIDEISHCDKIILPGQGSVAFAMAHMQERGLGNWLKDTRKPVLGICLGLQILAEYSEEGQTPCLSVIPGYVKKFTQVPKIPHMGWNTVCFMGQSPLLDHIPDQSYFYFAHSYYWPISTATQAITAYGVQFSSIMTYRNYFAVQFHPEKSGTQGLKLLHNFCNLC